MTIKDLEESVSVLEDRLDSNIADTKELFVDVARIIGTINERLKYVENELKTAKAQISRMENKGERLH